MKALLKYSPFEKGITSSVCLLREHQARPLADKTLRLVGGLSLVVSSALVFVPVTVTAQEVPVKLNGPMVAGGNVSTSAISPDDKTVVYLADQDTDGEFELFSVPVGGGVATKLNDPQANNGDVIGGFTITKDSTRVVYIAEQIADGVPELFVSPIEGGPGTRLSRDLPPGGRIADFSISPDGATVVYIGEQDTDGVTEIYSVPIDGGTVTKLNPPVGGGRNVLFTRLISADSSTVVYLADQDTNNVNELFSVPIGGGTVTKLNPPLPVDGDVGLFGFKMSPDGTRVVYSADQDTNNVHELFSVPVGGGTSVKLNAEFPSGVVFIADFQITPDSSTVVYRGEQNIDGIDELFSVPIEGGSITPVSTPGDNTFNFFISNDGSMVVYMTSTGGDGLDELFSAPVLGGTVNQLNHPVPAEETVDSFKISADSSTVTYSTAFIDNDVRGGGLPDTALFSVPIAGGSPIKLTPDFPAGSGLGGNDISPDSRFVVYRADQDTAGVFEIYGIPLGGGDSIKLNGPLVAGGDVGSLRFTSNSERITYEADQDTDQVTELYSLSARALGLTEVMFANGFE